MGACQTSSDVEPYSNELEIVRHPGAMQRTLRSVIRIQAVWRGFIFRKKMKASNAFRVAARLKPFQYDCDKTPGCILLKVPMRFTDGVYNGEWNPHRRAREGRGVMEYKDGGRYEGHWLKDKPGGRGRRVYASGDVYEGYWQEGVFSGEGTLTVFHGEKYSGTWKDGRKHGYGTETWTDGSRYTGEFYKGKKRGKGVLVWAGGARYEGMFVDGSLEGEGTYTWPDSSAYTGGWRKNKMHGHGTYRWPDGRVFEGEFVNDLREGRGTTWFPDGSVIDGLWREGRPDSGERTEEQGSVKTAVSSAAEETQVTGIAMLPSV